jgi:hypothetical protein
MTAAHSSGIAKTEMMKADQNQNEILSSEIVLHRASTGGA